MSKDTNLIHTLTAFDAVELEDSVLKASLPIKPETRSQIKNRSIWWPNWIRVMCNEYFLCIKFFKYCMIVIFTIITSSRLLSKLVVPKHINSEWQNKTFKQKTITKLERSTKLINMFSFHLASCQEERKQQGDFLCQIFCKEPLLNK